MIEKGKVVEVNFNGELAWVRVMGIHNSNGLQVRLETQLDSETFKIGQMFRLDPKDIIRELDNSNDD